MFKYHKELYFLCRKFIERMCKKSYLRDNYDFEGVKRRPKLRFRNVKMVLTLCCCYVSNNFDSVASLDDR